jgi:hypothetical protein
MKPLDFLPLPSDLACCSNDSGAVLPLDLVALPVQIKVRPDAPAQVLDGEGVVALSVKYRDERLLNSAKTPSHKRYRTEQFLPMQTPKEGAAEQALEEQCDGLFGTGVVAVLLNKFW